MVGAGHWVFTELPMESLLFRICRVLRFLLSISPCSSVKASPLYFLFRFRVSLFLGLGLASLVGIGLYAGSYKRVSTRLLGSCFCSLLAVLSDGFRLGVDGPFLPLVSE